MVKEFFKDFNVCIGFELIGYYFRNILYFLIFEGYDVMFINLLLINMDWKVFLVCKMKIDLIDVKVICMFFIWN